MTLGGVTISSLPSTRRQAGAQYLLFLIAMHSFMQCPIEYPGQRIPLLHPGIHKASGARLQHDGGRLVRFQLPEGRTLRVLFHACDVQKTLPSLSRSAGVLE